MTQWADRAAVEAALDEWTDGQIACRAYGHLWQPWTVRHRPDEFEVLQRCPRCSNRRSQRMDEQGYPRGSWQIEYVGGYLMDKKGRVGVDGRAALRLATLRGLVVEEVNDDDEGSEGARAV